MLFLATQIYLFLRHNGDRSQQTDLQLLVVKLRHFQTILEEITEVSYARYLPKGAKFYQN